MRSYTSSTIRFQRHARFARHRGAAWDGLAGRRVAGSPVVAPRLCAAPRARHALPGRRRAFAAPRIDLLRGRVCGAAAAPAAVAARATHGAPRKRSCVGGAPYGLDHRGGGARGVGGAAAHCGRAASPRRASPARPQSRRAHADVGPGLGRGPAGSKQPAASCARNHPRGEGASARGAQRSLRQRRGLAQGVGRQVGRAWRVRACLRAWCISQAHTCSCESADMGACVPVFRSRAD